MMSWMSGKEEKDYKFMSQLILILFFLDIKPGTKINPTINKINTFILSINRIKY